MSLFKVLTLHFVMIQEEKNVYLKFKLLELEQ